MALLFYEEKNALQADLNGSALHGILIFHNDSYSSTL